MKKVRIMVLLLLFVGLSISGCGIVRCKICDRKFGDHGKLGSIDEARMAILRSQLESVEPRIISVSGFGAPDTRVTNQVQRALMAIRASEVDAYRTLAERIKGVQVSGTTKVADFLTTYDHLRAVVDSYISWAKITSQGMTDEGYYETTLSLTLDSRFFYSFLSVPPILSSSERSSLQSGSNKERNESAIRNTRAGQSLIRTLSTTDVHYSGGGIGWGMAE